MERQPAIVSCNNATLYTQLTNDRWLYTYLRVFFVIMKAWKILAVINAKYVIGVANNNGSKIEHKSQQHLHDQFHMILL